MKEVVLLVLIEREKELEARIASAELFLSLAPNAELETIRLSCHQAALEIVKRAITWTQGLPS